MAGCGGCQARQALIDLVHKALQVHISNSNTMLYDEFVGRIKGLVTVIKDFKQQRESMKSRGIWAERRK
uniref:Uncharacterized protein n=1 Tax=viral metagenome TaxID=1070528 RepID=A0A6H1ZZC0_9ZZZZ